LKSFDFVALPSDQGFNDGHDTRAIQAYLGHRSIMSTVRYTALTPNRFKNFWKD
jgi:site-specific recombinase XerD